MESLNGMLPNGQLRKSSVEAANREEPGCIEIKQSVESPQAGHFPVPRAVRGENVLLDEQQGIRRGYWSPKETGRSGYRGYRASRNEGSQALQFTQLFLQRGEYAVKSTSHTLVQLLCGVRVVACASPGPLAAIRAFQLGVA